MVECSGLRGKPASLSEVSHRYSAGTRWPARGPGTGLGADQESVCPSSDMHPSMKGPCCDAADGAVCVPPARHLVIPPLIPRRFCGTKKMLAYGNVSVSSCRKGFALG